MIRQLIRPTSRFAAFAILLAVLALATLIGGPSASAQEKAPAATAKAAPPDDKVILPFIGEETFIVGRLDVARLDVDAVEAYMNKMVDDMVKNMGGALPPQAVQQMKQQMAAPMKEFREGVAEFRQAGGHHVYMLIDTADLANEGEPLLVTPIGEGADPVKLGELLSKMGDAGDMATAEVGKTLVFGSPERVDAVKERMAAAGGKPAAGGERPDLAKAFAAAGGDVPFRIAMVPGEAARKFMEENHPTLPEELGGGDIKVISRGVRWAAAGITLKPSITTNLTVQATDAESAKGLMDLVAKATEFLDAQQGPEAVVTKQLAALKPKLQGETITVSIDVGALQASLLGGRQGEVQVVEPEEAKPDDGGL